MARNFLAVRDQGSKVMDIGKDNKKDLTQQSGIRRVPLNDILDGEREIIICHQNDEYRLRLTSNNKLLLTK
jgi:hemin uptake protein HemP